MGISDSRYCKMIIIFLQIQVKKAYFSKSICNSLRLLFHFRFTHQNDLSIIGQKK